MIKKSRLVILTAFLAGCAHLFTGPAGEDALRQRVSKVWQAKMDNEWSVVYEFSTGNFKKSIKRDQFIRGCGLDVKAFSIEEIEFDPNETKATVTVHFDTQYMSFPLKGVQLKETWVWEERAWRLVMPTVSRSPF